ncbi:hypothetical protein N7488_002778 [Penicillium malachiteum]|nr:hypothetical protein N7488_002778 [Penicillium malachiteum]
MRDSPSSFAALMALQRLDDNEVNNISSDPEKIERFQSLAAPYPPGLGNRAFGGHVYAQSAYAASKTVEKGDGYMYSTRAVDARQNGKICFSCLCSFKRDEGFQDFQHQPLAVQDRYRDILSVKRPEEQEVSPSIDVDWWMEATEKGDITEKEFPGLDVRKVDMQDFNQSEEIKTNPEKYRQLTQYCLKGSPDEQADATIEEIRKRELAGEYDNLYACAHMYSSDKNSLLLIPRALGFTRWADMGSLSLTVIVHRHGSPLRMIDWDAVSKNGNSSLQMKWFIQEGWSPQSAENRLVHESHLWSPDGKLIATSMQDGMLRVQKLPSRGKL